MNLRDKLKFWMALSNYVDMIVRGTSPLSLPDAIANSLSYVKAFGGTEQRNVPDGYTQLEYIQSSGSQYIDTGRVPNNDDIIEQKFQKVGSSDTTCAWYGSMPSSQIITPRIGIGTYLSQGVSSMFAGSNYTGNIGVADTNVHTLRFQATGQTELTYTLDGVTDVIDASTSTVPPDMYEPAVELTSYLFARHGTNGVQVYDNEGTKIYYHREYLANGTLALNMVPVKRNRDNVLGMYDLVSGQFFTNQGTGDFVAGPTAVPTPDAPMDIVSNNGVLKYGVLGKNLFNVSANSLEQGGIASNDGQDTASSYYQRVRTNGYIPVKPSTTYTASVKDLQIYYLEYAQDTTYTNRHASGFSDNSVTFTTGANTYFVRLQFRKSDNADIAPSEVTNVQLEQGSTATEYEPYREGIYTDGTVETINAHGKNLFDSANNKAFVSEGQTVTISFINPGFRTTVTTDTDVVVMTRSSGQIGYQSETVVIPAGATYLTVAQGYSNASEVQIELGSTATTYVPYYDGGSLECPMLLSVGDYQDEFILEN